MEPPTRRDATRPAFDPVIQNIADYVLSSDRGFSEAAWQTARYCWMDSIGCALSALQYPACRKLLGPLVPGAGLAGGARVPGTSDELDPVRAAWNIGAMIRWLDFNDTWLAAEWGHPSDNLGAILALADYQSRPASAASGDGLLMVDVLRAMIRAHEIQGILALTNSFNRVGLDHVVLVRVASAAVSAAMLDLNREQIVNVISQAWLDGSALRTYRHAPNTGTRKSWAAGDASSRGLFLSLLGARGEMGYPSALSAPQWGFEAVSFQGQAITQAQPFGCYVMENVLFKISYPAEFHAQTAVEAAVALSAEAMQRYDDISAIYIETQESADRIINKVGPLDNPADRDHCLQYMVAVALLRGGLTAEDYEDAAASDPRIDALRNKMQVRVSSQFSEDYLAADKRAIGNAIQIEYRDGSRSDRVAIDYPVGHRRRRDEGLPLLIEKFERHLGQSLDEANCKKILSLCDDQKRFEQTSVNTMMGLLAAPQN